ncbi:MAG: efflux RND transporter permease subunit [Leptospiraceae bacterium]|nr:efflux RND transporter permease subunit [Leptospiraceae bacterium]
MKFRGEQESTNKSMASLASAGIIAFFGIFAILALIFNNTIKPVVILFSIPLGLIGVIFGFLISNKSLSFLAMIGIIGLAGVIVNTSIVLVDCIDELQKKGMDKYESLAKAASSRFRPIILTTITTMAGLIPTAYGINWNRCHACSHDPCFSLGTRIWNDRRIILHSNCVFYWL